MNQLLFSLLGLFLTSLTAHGWSIDGHLYVSNIAYDLLEENAPDALAAANTMLTYLQVADPDMTTHEDKHALVECATFADDLKYHGEGWQGDYHFVDLPWVSEGSASDYNITSEDRNLTEALPALVAWLSQKQGTDYKTSSIYTHLMEEFDDENVAKSYGLRLIVHYMGDIM